MKAYSLLVIEAGVSRGGCVVQLPDATTDIQAIPIVVAAGARCLSSLQNGVEYIITGPGPDFTTIFNYKEAST